MRKYSIKKTLKNKLIIAVAVIIGIFLISGMVLLLNNTENSKYNCQYCKEDNVWGFLRKVFAQTSCETCVYLHPHTQTINPGGSATLMLGAKDGTGTATCSINHGVLSPTSLSAPWTPEGAVYNFTVSPAATTTYKARCTGSGGTAEHDATVILNKPPTCSLVASETIIDEGETVTFTGWAKDSDGTIDTKLTNIADYTWTKVSDSHYTFSGSETFNSSGSYTKYIKGTDNDGAWFICEVNIRVSLPLPKWYEVTPS